MKTVLIIQAQMKHYRVPLFDKLHAALAEDGVELRVAYSDPPPQELGKKDNAELTEEYGVKVRGYWLFGHRILYQPLASEIARADLIIVEQAAKNVLNIPLLLLRQLRLKKVAFWGHGKNWRANASRITEWTKELTLARVDWWFAFTSKVTEYLKSRGVPVNRVTTLNNAIDTAEFRGWLASVTEDDLVALQRELKLKPGARVGLFCGGVTREKAPEFLIEAAQRIKTACPGFELLLLGGGPEENVFKSAAASAPWIHYVGPKFGREKAALYRLADAFLMPGLVGLAILDAFTAGLPILTTDMPVHSPEIEYLENGRNGLVTKYDVEAYAQAVASLLSDHDRLGVLQEGAALSGKTYTIENMAIAFRQGILGCLNMNASPARSSRPGPPAASTRGCAPGLEPLGERPLVSVLMANYNYGNFIGPAIESVLRQSYTHFEMIVCDDGSTDHSCQVVRGYAAHDTRLRLIEKANGGQASAFNAAFQSCRGEIVCLLDSDDLFEPMKLKRIVDMFRSDPECGIVYHFVRVIDESGQTLKIMRYDKEGFLGPACHATLHPENMLPACSGLAFRRQVLEKIFPLPELFRVYADAAIVAPAVYLAPCRIVSTVLSEWRMHSRNSSGCGSLLPTLTVEWLEKQLYWHETSYRYVREFLERRNMTGWSLLAFRPILEYRLALAILQGERQKSGAAVRDLVRAFRNSRSDYPWSRIAFWTITASLPSFIGTRLLRAGFAGFRRVSARRGMGWNAKTGSSAPIRFAGRPGGFG